MNNQRRSGTKSKVLLYSQDHDLYFRLAVKHAMRKDFYGSLKYINLAIEKDEYNTEYLFNKACLLVELKRTRESIKLLNYIIWNIDPTYSECYFGLGCNYFEIGNYEKALHYFEKYVLMEDDGDFCEDAYEILFYMRLPGEEIDFDLDSQIDMSEKAQKRHRDSSMKLHATGSMYLNRGNYKEAIRQFERSIMAYPEIKSSRIRLSMAYYMTGQLAMAKLLASSVLKMQKNHRMAKLCLALYYSTEGLTDMSERILSVFARMRGKKQYSAQEGEDRKFYEQMLKVAPVGEELKTKLFGVAQKLYMLG
ncbi:MAG: tetratricopeptide repeat protein [Oscillospiraceae bacterium]|nr:tetratricopeptide repeat protein [Oscillospiraceae bacterium]